MFIPFSPGFTGAEIYALGGALFAIGNGCMYLAYRKGWSVVRSVLLKPLVTLILAASGVVFLDNQITLSLIIGGLLILLAAALVKKPGTSSTTKA